MKKYLLYILFLISLVGLGQGGFKREYVLPNSSINIAKAVFEGLSPNNYIACGLTLDTMNGQSFNCLTLFGVDNSGQKTWVKKFGNKKFQYLENFVRRRWFYKQDNSIYHTGCVLDSNNKYLGVLIKFSLIGDSIWQRKFYDPTADLVPQSVCGSVDGGFLITGYLIKSGGENLALLIKTDINGKELWRKEISKPAPNVQDGRVIIQDTLTKKIILGGSQLIGSTMKDNVIICDSLGNKLSQYNYNSIGGIISDMIQTKDKKIIAVGQTRTGFMVGNEVLHYSFIIKFDLNSPGSPIWKKDNFDKLSLKNSFNSVKELANGNILCAGVIDTMIQLNLPEQCYNRMTVFNSDGSLLWNRHYSYSKSLSSDHIQFVNSLNLASNGDWLCAIESPLPTPPPFFFVRYDSTGCDSTVSYCSVGLSENKMNKTELQVFPNPVKSILALVVPNINILNNFTINIFDVNGKLVITDRLKSDDKIKLINMDNYYSGLYLVQLISDNGQMFTKIIHKE